MDEADLLVKKEKKPRKFYSSSNILTLIGMREGTFIPLYFLDWILSAEYFWRWKWTSIGLIWHPDKVIESYKKSPQAGGAKDEHFSCF